MNCKNCFNVCHCCEFALYILEDDTPCDSCLSKENYKEFTRVKKFKYCPITGEKVK